MTYYTHAGSDEPTKVPIDQAISELKVKRDNILAEGDARYTELKSANVGNGEVISQKVRTDTELNNLYTQIKELKKLQAGGEVGLDLPNHMSASKLGWTDLAGGNLCPLI